MVKLLVLFLISILYCEKNDPIYQLVKRIVPQLSNQVVFSLKNSQDDYFKLQTNETHILIEGNNRVSLSVGLNHYLQQLNNSLTWTGDNLSSLTFTQISPIHKNRSFKYSYYLNTCTYSYSMVWWSWERWQREIDWMALQGVNLPLMQIGQEYIWLQIYLTMGLKENDILYFFGGPAFQAWQRMGNIQGYGGSMPVEWLRQQSNLAMKIVQRMRELDMKVVLPTFSGFVPDSLFSVFPSSRIYKGPAWNNFPSEFTNVSFIDPTDPLFKQLGQQFLEFQSLVYNGTDHFYSGDQFNENLPLLDTQEYIQQAGQAMMENIQEVDSEGVWVMQGWMFFYQSEFWTKDRIKAYIQNLDNVLILDLSADLHEVYKDTESFYNQPFIWTELHDFGQNYGMYGRMQIVNNNPFEAKKNSTIQGIGISMEGINQNYIVYEFMLSQAWEDQPQDLSQYVSKFISRRYNKTENYSQNGWQSLLSKIYSYPKTDRKGTTKSLIEFRPDFNLLSNKGWPFETYYPICDIYQIMMDLRMADLETEGYQYDLVDVTRQFLSDLFLQAYKMMEVAKINKDKNWMLNISNHMLDIIQDMNKLLGSNKNFLFGKWIEDAKNSAKSFTNSTEIIEQFRFNAVNQVTVWGPRSGNNNDYASKSWNGLMLYYQKRWQIFIKYALDFDDFNQEKYLQEIQGQCLFYRDYEQEYQGQDNQYALEPEGNTKQLVDFIINKYSSIIDCPQNQ